MAEYIDRAQLRGKAVYLLGYGKIKYVPLKAIEDAQAVAEPALTPAKYISTGPDELYCDFGDCSLCGGEMPVGSKFCPNCGHPIIQAPK